MPDTLWTDIMDSLDKKYYKISEVSEILGIPMSTLRFWEGKFTIIKPHRNEGGTRFYSPSDIEKIRMIHYLVKEKKLRLDAAEEQIKKNPSGVSKRFEAIERLKGVRQKLNELLVTLNKMR